MGGLCGLGASDLIPNGESAFGAKIDLKPATHLAILYSGHGDRQKSSGVSGAAIAIFADRSD